MTTPVHGPRFTCLVSLALFACAFAPAHAATVTIGSTGCSYTNFQFALDQLAAMPGPHEIRLRTQTFSVPDGLVLNAIDANWLVRGGYASCGDSTPTAGQRSIIDASGGGNGSALTIDAASSTTNLVEFRRVTVRGGTAEASGAANPGGGGLDIRGRAFVILDQDTRIEDNESDNGGGVFVRGTSASARAFLQILGGSRVADNSAIDLGGGIFCSDSASIYIDDGLVSGNVAAMGGGGLFMRLSCRMDSIVVPGSLTGIVGNQASVGGGVYGIGDSAFRVEGASNSPFLFSDNTASTEGGGLRMINSDGDRAAVDLLTAVISGNQALRGAAFSFTGGFDVTMRPRHGDEQCDFSGIDFGACSAVTGNIAPLTDGSGSATSVMRAWNSPIRSPDLVIRRTAILDNEGDLLLDGLLRSESQAIEIEQSLIARNHVGGGLLIIANTEEFFPSTGRITWSTITANTRVREGSYVLLHFATPMDLTGSILHDPDFLGRSSSTGPVTHGGCLLVHDAATWPAAPIPPRVGDPLLPGDLVPPLSSPAIDICSSASAPATDFRGNPRVVDQVGVPDINGPVDLGAIELGINDTIFTDGFD